MELIFKSGTGVEDWYNVIALWLGCFVCLHLGPPPHTQLVHHGWLRQSMPVATKHNLGFKHTSSLCVAAWHRSTLRPHTHTPTQAQAQSGKHTHRERERERERKRERDR